MSKKYRLIVVAYFVGACASSLTSDANEPVDFDAPAMLTGYLVDEEASNTTDTIRVDIPISLLHKNTESFDLDELLIAVYWATRPNFVSDFEPKTTLASDIDGSISVKQSADNNGSIGINSKGSYPGLTDVNAQLKLGNSKRESTTYQCLPKQNLLAASGSIKRGTGVYFKFRKSSQTTLEGTHHLSLSFKVPKHWRAGLLRIDCQLRSKRRGSNQSAQQTFNREFVSAVHLHHDALAYELAMAYVEHENYLLELKHSQHQAKKPTNLLTQLGSLVEKPAPAPIDWYRHIVYTHSEKAFRKLQSQLSSKVRDAANDFLSARKQLTSLHR